MKEETKRGKVAQCIKCLVHFKEEDLYRGEWCYDCVGGEDHDCSDGQEDGCGVCAWRQEYKSRQTNEKLLI